MSVDWTSGCLRTVYCFHCTLKFVSQPWNCPWERVVQLLPVSHFIFPDYSLFNLPGSWQSHPGFKLLKGIRENPHRCLRWGLASYASWWHNNVITRDFIKQRRQEIPTVARHPLKRTGVWGPSFVKDGFYTVLNLIIRLLEYKFGPGVEMHWGFF